MLAINGEQAVSFWEDIKLVEKDLKKQGRRISEVSLEEMELLYRHKKLEKL